MPEAAAAIVRLADTLRTQIAESAPVEHNIPADDPALGGAMTTEMLFAAPAVAVANPTGTSPLINVYETIDLPLVSVLLRMEQAGVRIDPSFFAEMSTRLAVEIDNLAERIYRTRASLQHQLAEAAWRRAVQQDAAAQADEVWQGQGGFDGAGCSG